jgi:hypothetical protein
MKKLFFLSIVSLAIFAQSALTKEEKLELENAGLRLQLLKVQEQETQKRAKEVFESACKRANIPLDKCRLDQAKGELVKQEEAAKK